MRYIVWLTLAIAFMLACSKAAVACDDAQRLRYKNAIADADKQVKELEHKLDYYSELGASYFLTFGKVPDATSVALHNTSLELGDARALAKATRKYYKQFCGDDQQGSAKPVGATGSGTAESSARLPPAHGAAGSAFGTTKCTNVPEHDPVQMTCGNVTTLGYRDTTGGTMVLTGPADLSTIAGVGTKGKPMTRSLRVNCPKRKSASGSAYHFLCTFGGAEYRPRTPQEDKLGSADDYKFMTANRYGNAELSLTFAGDGKNSTVSLFLGTAHVCDQTKKPWHCFTEGPRPVKLTSAPL